MQTIKPSKDYIFAKPEETVSQTASGILVATKTAYKPKIAEAVNVGSEVSTVKSGDKFVYKSYATTDIQINGEDYLLIADEDVLGVVLDVQE